MTDPETLERLRLIADPKTLATIEISVEDLTDPDARSEAIRADHPAFDQALGRGEDEVRVNGEPINVRLHFAMHDVVASQLVDDHPPDVYLTARRLLDAGYDRHEILHMLAGTIAEQIQAALTERGHYDRERHVAALNALPGSWEQQPTRPPLNRAERRARPRHRPG